MMLHKTFLFEDDITNMFDENINLIRGHSSSGKTEFIIDLANSLVDSGFKICFISTKDENRYHRNKFTFYRSLSNRFEEDYKMFQLVSEIIIRDNYDYLFIDDIDSIYDDHFFSDKQIDKFLEILINTPVKKILTCDWEESIHLPITSKTSAILFSNIREYYIIKEYNEDKDSNDSLIKKEQSGTLESTTDVIKKTIRDIKIENILK
jgi:hypothetical protein